MDLGRYTTSIETGSFVGSAFASGTGIGSGSTFAFVSAKDHLQVMGQRGKLWKLLILLFMN